MVTQITLPKLSEKISVAINDASDAIAAQLSGEGEDELTLIKRCIPESLLALASDRVEVLPQEYRKHFVASILASRLVYKEGLFFIDSLPKDSLAEVSA